MSKDQVPYIKHDVNASSDIKCKALRKKYGWEGQGWFWDLVEKLRSEKDYRLEYNELTFNSLAEDYKCDTDKIKTFIDDCVKIYKLFSIDDNFIHSPRLDRDMQELNNLKEINRNKGFLSAEKRRLNLNNQQRLNCGSTEDTPKLNSDQTEVDETSTAVQLGKDRVGEDRVGEVKLKDRVGEDRVATRNPFIMYEKNVGQLTGIISEQIIDAQKEYTNDWVCDAIESAVKKEIRRWDYIEGTLRGWRRDGKKNNNSKQPIVIIKDDIPDYVKKRQAQLNEEARQRMAQKTSSVTEGSAV